MERRKPAKERLDAHLSVLVTKDLMRWLEKRAKREGVSVGAVAREILESRKYEQEHLANHSGSSYIS